MRIESLSVPSTVSKSHDPFDTAAYRAIGIVFGAGTQLLFLWTVIQLFQFLRYGGAPSRTFSPLLDAVLAATFVVPHSILLLPKTQRSLRTYIPSGWLGCLHCTVSCLTLLLMFTFWSGSSRTIWSFDHASIGEPLMLFGFYSSWIALFYSLYLTGLGYQTGLTQWWYWLKKVKPPRREFTTKGAYLWLRHPVYLSFLGLIWFTPKMSLDHAIMTSVWTIYIYIGSVLKDKRLLHYIGTPYQTYAEKVPGYPCIRIGPLARWRPSSDGRQSIELATVEGRPQEPSRA